MKSIFITGTDTGIGKSIATGLLARAFMKKGESVITQKWIETGCKKYSEDIKTHLKLMGIKKQTMENYLPYMNPYAFKFPSSPHLAAKLEKRIIDSAIIKKSFKFLGKLFDRVIVEGAGGALVPFSEKKLIIDIAKKLKLPALIVVGNKLGAINHTLATIEALKKRGIKIVGLVFNNLDKTTHPRILKDNIHIIKSLTGEKILGVVPFSKDKTKLHKAFQPITAKLKNL